MKLAWSNLAKDDLRELRRYSTERWGREVIQRYLRDIRDAARCIAVKPDRARPLKGSFRLVRVRSHYLIVQVESVLNRLTVARVLHTAMDLERHIPSG